jgi:hypothetical protein
LIGWATTGGDDLRRAAGIALEKIEHPAVRAAAIGRIGEGRGVGGAARWLVPNFEEGDWAIFVDLAGRELPADEYHHLGSAILDAADLDPGDEAASALLAVYERDPCSECRWSVVTRLDDQDAVPDWMEAECLHDSNHEIREWATARRSAGTGTGPGG